MDYHASFGLLRKPSYITVRACNSPAGEAVGGYVTKARSECAVGTGGSNIGLKEPQPLYVAGSWKFSIMVTKASLTGETKMFGSWS